MISRSSSLLLRAVARAALCRGVHVSGAGASHSDFPDLFLSVESHCLSQGRVRSSAAPPQQVQVINSCSSALRLAPARLCPPPTQCMRPLTCLRRETLYAPWKCTELRHGYSARRVLAGCPFTNDMFPMIFYRWSFAFTFALQRLHAPVCHVPGTRSVSTSCTSSASRNSPSCASSSCWSAKPAPQLQCRLLVDQKLFSQEPASK